MQSIRIIYSTLIVLFALSSYSQEVQIVTEEFPPYNYSENGTIKGISTEILNAVLKEIDVKANIKIYPWARTYKMAQTQSNVLIYSMARDKKRENLFQWVGSVAPVQTCFFSLANSNIKIERLEDSKNHTVITQLNGRTAQALIQQGFIEGKNLFTSTSTNNALKMLEKGRGELLGYPELVIYHIIRKMGKNPKDVVKKAFCFEKVSVLYLAFSLDTPKHIVEQFKQGLKTIKDNGTHKRILEEYFD